MRHYPPIWQFYAIVNGSMVDLRPVSIRGWSVFAATDFWRASLPRVERSNAYALSGANRKSYVETPGCWETSLKITGGVYSQIYWISHIP